MVTTWLPETLRAAPGTVNASSVLRNRYLGGSWARAGPIGRLRCWTTPAAAPIPAHPLALDAGRKFDARRQRALSRYYLDAGSGGLAVGVHTTQFAIRDVGLYQPVLELAMRTATEWSKGRPHR